MWVWKHNADSIRVKKRATISESLLISFKKSDSIEKTYLSYVFDSFNSFSFFLSTGSIRSPRFLQKSDRKRIAHVTLYKKATISESIPLIFKKEQQEQFSIFH